MLDLINIQVWLLTQINVHMSRKTGKLFEMFSLCSRLFVIFVREFKFRKTACQDNYSYGSS